MGEFETKTSLARTDPFKIKDTGIGMSKSVLNKVFDYTYSTKSEEGMGFGLAICRQIVYSHGGDLAFESELGKWTSVFILLPREGQVVDLNLDTILGGDN